MWMMGCSDGSGCGYNMSDSFNNPRKLRPLFPKPSTSNPYVGNGHAAATSTTHPCFNRIHGTDLFLLNHHHLVTEQSRRDVNVTTPTMVSSRWNPTPEQLHTLEELYRGGTRTPSAEQIQHITAQLRRYGKIEGKNVFYWFQNHKARERQKRRRQTEELIEHKESSDIEVDQEEAKNWGLSTTNMNSSHIHQDSVSMQRAVRTEESRTDGWIHMGEREFQHRRRSLERWQKMHLTYSPPITFTTPTTPTTTNTTTTSTVYTNNLNFNMPDKECRESHTLELFPIRNHETSNSNNAGKDTQGVSTSGTTYKFFEFL